MEFRILGPLEVEADGRIVKLGGSKQRGVLALLLLNANKAVSRDRLIDEVWGDEPPDTAATALQGHISQLRKTLGADAIVTQAPGYLIRLADGELDLDRFEGAVARARAAAAPEAADTLKEALALWRGPALADLDLPFAHEERTSLEEQRLAALERRIDADLELGRNAELLSELERLVQQHPLREHLRGQLMLALYRSGRQADALDVYRSGRRALAEQLGLEPGEELRRLERGILEQDPALGAPAATAAMPPRVPSGTVTFLFTDIESSTRLVQELGDGYGELLEQHHRLVRDALGRHGGEEIDTQGDAFFFAFRRARDAVQGAVDAQRSLTEATWPAGATVRIRMGIHTGEPGIAQTGYHGLDVVRAARISGAAHGGQTLVSSATRDLVGSALEDVTFADLGEHRLKDLERPEHIFEVAAPGLQADFPPLETSSVARVMTIGGREDELAAAAGAALATEERRVRRFRRSWVIAAAGAVLLAAAIVGAVLALTSGSSDATVTVAPNSVAVIDHDSGKVVGDVAIGGRPVSVAIGEGAVWVTNADDGTVTRIDPKTYEVVKTIGLGADVNYVVVGFGSVWVAGGNDETLFRIDPESNAIEGKVQFHADPLVPRPVFFVAAGQKAIWITRGDSLVRVDPRTTEATKTIPLPGIPNDLGAGEGSVWVSLGDERLTRVLEGSATIASTTPVPGLAGSPVVTAGALWMILYTDTPQVSKFDPNNVTQAASVSFPNTFLASLAGDDGMVWTMDHTTGRVWRVEGGEPTRTLVATVGHHPVSIASGDGATWVGVQGQELLF
jgi:DNA-binding SARP family transcriptional activator/streptogramin lyase